VTAATLVKTRLTNGIWEGVLTGPDSAPALSVTHLGLTVPDLAIVPLDSGGWFVRVPLPLAAVADGVQTVLIADAATGDRLAEITLIAGDALDADIRAEVNLLRAELDMLKRAFRRHCVETAGG
jgi:hypothetical protein